MGPTLLGLAASLLAAPHDDSASFSLLEVTGRELAVSLRVQALSVLEVQPWLDQDGDGLLAAAELEAREPELGRYVLEHYRLRSGGAALSPGAFPTLAPDPAAVRPGSWVLLRWRCHAPATLRDLALEVDLFEITSPGHLEFTEVRWNGTRLAGATLGPQGRRWSFEAPGVLASLRAPLPGVWTRPGPWCLAALTWVLLLGAGEGRSAPFRVALVALLACAGGLVWVTAGGARPPVRAIDLAAILGVAYVGADVALLPRRRAPWLEAAVFGALLGLSHGLDLAPRLAGEVGAPWRALSELGALLGTGALGLALARAQGRRRRRAVAGTVAALGLAFFAWRALG